MFRKKRLRDIDSAFNNTITCDLQGQKALLRVLGCNTTFSVVESLNKFTFYYLVVQNDIPNKNNKKNKMYSWKKVMISAPDKPIWCLKLTHLGKPILCLN